MTPRGTGRTTKQIDSLPDGSVFVWVSSDTRYPRDLAVKLGKKIQVVNRSWIVSDRWRGRDFPCVEVDHAIKPSMAEMVALRQIAHRQLSRRPR